MKKLTLFIAFLLGTIILIGQSDIIYPAEGGNIIFNCNINEVKNGNEVYYTKDSITDVVVAVAITKDGNYIDLSEYVNKLNAKVYPPDPLMSDALYRGHDFDYYNELYKGAKYQATSGTIFTILGICGLLAGNRIDQSDKNEKLASGFYIGGAIFFNIGLPIWISGSIKAGNNKRAREECENNTKLSFGTTNNGVGLVLNF
jgi:hypothetical protein